jgi:SAM-dependent methyltransferase
MQYSLKNCVCCGSQELNFYPILWSKLINDWNLSPREVDYINYQQGLHCAKCKCNLRSMALATAIMRTYQFNGLFKDFIHFIAYKLPISILEINEAGGLTPYLKQLQTHTIASYPNVNMMNMPYETNTYDLILHSDTLEHIEYPIKALAECHRVLKKDGFLIYTVPVIVDRLTRSRMGLPPSSHTRDDSRLDYLVHTEDGADVWKQIHQAGFVESRIISLEFPAALALVAVK